MGKRWVFFMQGIGHIEHGDKQTLDLIFTAAGEQKKAIHIPFNFRVTPGGNHVDQRMTDKFCFEWCR